MNAAPGRSGVPERVIGNPALMVALIALVSAFFFLPFLGRVSLFDWDEANFAEASREMIERGAYTRVTIDYQPFYQKPPLFMWLQVLSMKALGVNEFAARFVNAVCGMVTLSLLFLIGRRLYSPLFGLLWALAFFGSFLPHFFFRSGIIDPVFNLLIFLGLTLSAELLSSASRRRRFALAVSSGLLIGLAILAKGPVALLVICLVMGIYWIIVRFRPLFSLAELCLFFAATGLAASIFFGIETATNGSEFIKQFVAYQIKLFSTGDSGHGRPFYFHFFVLFFGCFPASFFAIISFFRRDTAADSQRLFDRLMLILFWIVLILFSIVRTKTVLYSSLAWFPITYLCARSCNALILNKLPFSRPLFVSLVSFGALVTLAIAFFPVLIMNRQWIVPLIRDAFAVACLENPVHWTGYEFLLGIGYGIALFLSLRLFKKNRPVHASLALFGSSALCLFMFMYIFAPKIEAYSQGGPVAFYKEHAGKEVYVRALFKSYTDLFYSRKKPGGHPRSHDKEWLLTGDIDKPAYFVARVTQTKRYDRDATLDLVRLKSEYGFVYYKREPNTAPGQNSPAVENPVGGLRGQ
ncbi:MAG: glycosyltransferase family 39 protein [Chitinispirillaceae bacterium]|nr:glycosyltransferase family 39 protein [Chitinispirillaceae bacterium]